MLDNTEGAIKNGKSRDTGYIGYTGWRKTKQQHNNICVGHHCVQANRNKVNKIGGNGEPYAEIVTDITAWNLERKDP